MYSYIKGTLVEIKADHCILDVEGIGYMIYTPLHFYTGGQKPDGRVLLHTSFIVREDSMRLFGFEKVEEKELFEKLISISGLGPKTAMAIIGQSDTVHLPSIIAQKDTVALTKVPGIGKKTAERIIIELSDKLSSLTKTENTTSPVTNDAIAALVSLGFKEKEARSNVEKVLKRSKEELTLTKLISLSLARN